MTQVPSPLSFTAVLADEPLRTEHNFTTLRLWKKKVFKRKCLRACLSQYSSAKTNYFYYISNKKIYNKAKVARIDNFILKLIRNHFASTRSVLTNGLIQGLTYPNPLYFVKTLASGHIPPEAFLYLDKKGFMQNNKNIPIIYHAIPRAGNTKITFPSNLGKTNSSDLCRYSTALLKRDIKDKHRRNIERYWWLDTWVQWCANCKWPLYFLCLFNFI